MLERLGWYRNSMDDFYKCPFVFDGKEFTESTLVEKYNRLGEKSNDSFEFVCVLVQGEYSIVLGEPFYYVTIASEKVSPISLFILRSSQ